MPSEALRRFLHEFPRDLQQDAGAVFLGAGVSVAAGYPSWSGLLKDIGNDLGVRSADVHDLAALAQWSVREHGGATRVRSVISSEIGVNRPVPPAIEIIARLPLRHIWTTNYDRLVERAFDAIHRPLVTVSAAADLAIRGQQGAARLYKMHGSVDRLDELVISTDDYELYGTSRRAFLALLQAHLMSMSMLFVGISFTDPNVRLVLSLIRESFTDAPPEHFAFVKPPERTEYNSEDEFRMKLAQHNHWSKDLQRYGLTAIELESFEEVPTVLRDVERTVARARVWVSGSLPSQGGPDDATRTYDIADRVGNLLGRSGLALISGAGLGVGSASLSGFLDALRVEGGWDLDRRLIARPFPQPPEGEHGDKLQWTALRTEMARLAGVVIFVAGSKVVQGDLIAADGVLEEARLAREAGAFLLPIGSTGGAAAAIAEELLGSALTVEGSDAVRPFDDELTALSDKSKPASEVLEIIEKILKRVALA